MAGFNSIPELIEDIKNGKMVILIDDEDRENEGDIVIAAQHINPEKVNFMVKEARGLVCLSLTQDQCDQLDLDLMVRDDRNFSPNKTAFTASIEAAEGVTTGISAADRSHTISVAAKADAKAGDIISPGHVFPIRAQDGGVLKRAGHTEGSVDLCRLANLEPAAVICEVMNDDGTMARVEDLKHFAEKHQMKIGTIVDLIEYRLQNETLVEEISGDGLFGELSEGFTTRIFKSHIDGMEHVVLTKGEIDSTKPVLVRVQSEDMMTDLLTSLRARTFSKLAKSAELIDKEGSGVLLYLRRPVQSVKSNKAPTKIDMKDYGIGAQILRAVGVRELRLLSDFPQRRIALKGYGLEIVETLPIEPDSGKGRNEKITQSPRGGLK